MMTTSSKAAIDHAPAKFRNIIIDAPEGGNDEFPRHGGVDDRSSPIIAREKKSLMRGEPVAGSSGSRLHACDAFG
jgi:hypothetical protein